MSVFRSVTVAIAAGVLLTQVPAAQSPQPQAPVPQRPSTFRSGVDLIQVDVQVVDKQGNPVHDLNIPDFTVAVDGKPRRITALDFVVQDASPEPAALQYDPPVSGAYATNTGPQPGRLFVLVIDQGNITRGGGKGAMQAAMRFLGRLSPADKVGLVTIPVGPKIEFTGNRNVIRDALARIQGGGANAYQGWTKVSLAEAFMFVTGSRKDVWAAAKMEECDLRSQDEIDRCIREMEHEARLKVSAAHSAGMATVQSLETLLTNLASVDGQKYIVMVSQGLVTGSTFGFLEGRHDFDRLGVLADRARASFYILHFARQFLESVDVNEIFMSRTSSDDASLLSDGLAELAGKSSGTVFRLMTAADASFDRVVRETSAAYVLAVETEAGDRDGRPHDISVKTSRAGLQVRARRQFVAEPEPAALAPAEVRLTRAIQAPLLPTALPVDLSTYVVEDAGTMAVRVLIAAELACGADASGPLDVAFSLATRSGALVSGSLGRAEATVQRKAGETCAYFGADVSVPPDDYLLRFVATDASGRTGGVEHRFTGRLGDAPPYRMSSLLTADPAEKPGGQVRLLVGAVLPRQGAVAAYVEVSVATPAAGDPAAVPPVVQFEVASGEGGPPISAAAAALQPGTAAGHWRAEATLNLGALPAGRYFLRATVLAGGKTIGRVSRPVIVPARGARP